ncbi:MAG TPA: hypothetical protein VF292_04635 [Rhodanobacteraceae bacterium]
MRGSLGLLLLLAVPAVAVAATPRVEDTMVVSGTLTVGPRGGVQSYRVHGFATLPPAAREILQATIPHWAFVPIMAHGKPVAARTDMYVRIVADFTGDNRARVTVAGAQFGCGAWQTRRAEPNACARGTRLSYANRRPPMYPMDAARDGVGAETLLELQIGRDGRVAHAAVRQVNLYTRTPRPAFWRQLFAAASVRAARRWRFHVPTAGPNAAKAWWDVTVPVNYTLRDRTADACGQRHRYGHWCAYLPGPVQSIPWAHDAHAQADDVAAVAGGAPFLRDPRFVLKAPSTGAAKS